MDDLISRQEAIDAVENIDCSDGVGISALKCEAVDDGVTAIKALPSAQPETHEERTETHACDCISRQAAIDALEEERYPCESDYDEGYLSMLDKAIWIMQEWLPSAQPDMSEYSDKLWKAAYERGRAEAQQRWIPCSERLPEDIRPVIVTWKNTDPASYYQYIVGKHFTGTACYKNGKWYWYSSTTEDMLSEYGRYDSEEFDEAIECIAWMPLPEPYAERRTDERSD